MSERPPWLAGRETHAEMLPRIRAENEAWAKEYRPRLKEADERAAERRAAILAAIESHPDPKARELLKGAML